MQSSVTVQDNQGSVTGVQINQPSMAVSGDVYNIAGNLSIGDIAGLAASLHRLRAPMGDFFGRAAEIERRWPR